MLIRYSLLFSSEIILKQLFASGSVNIVEQSPRLCLADYSTIFTEPEANNVKYKKSLDQSDCRKLFVQLWNYTNVIYNQASSLSFKAELPIIMKCYLRSVKVNNVLEVTDVTGTVYILSPQRFPTFWKITQGKNILKSFAKITACRFEKSQTGSHSAVGSHRGILVIRD